MLIPDYVQPDALLVPHLHLAVRPILESIALAASSSTGVILLSDDPASSEVFAQGSPDSKHINIVTAYPDTLWIRDLSPFPVIRANELYWLQPESHMPERKLDAALFQNITRKSMEQIRYRMPRGNVVVGADGLMLSTSRFFVDNELQTTVDLRPLKQQLGVSSMLFFPALHSDVIAHADCYVRFLSPTCVALAWIPEHPAFQANMKKLADVLRANQPSLSILWIPVKEGKDTVASPLNWIQLGTRLLVPNIPELTTKERDKVSQTITREGFQLTWLPAPGIELGGSVHCLTASIFSSCPESL